MARQITLLPNEAIKTRLNKLNFFFGAAGCRGSVLGFGNLASLNHSYAFLQNSAKRKKNAFTLKSLIKGSRPLGRDVNAHER